MFCLKLIWAKERPQVCTYACTHTLTNNTLTLIPACIFIKTSLNILKCTYAAPTWITYRRYITTTVLIFLRNPDLARNMVGHPRTTSGQHQMRTSLARPICMPNQVSRGEMYTIISQSMSIFKIHDIFCWVHYDWISEHERAPEGNEWREVYYDSVWG